MEQRRLIYSISSSTTTSDVFYSHGVLQPRNADFLFPIPTTKFPCMNSLHFIGLMSPATSVAGGEGNATPTSTTIGLFGTTDYLNIKGLLDLMVRTVSDMIWVRSPEEIRQILGIENDFTPEEEAAIRSENPWAFEQMLLSSDLI